MEKMIAIDGKEMRMVANGATPLYYRTLFQKDVFEDVQNMMTPDRRIKDVSALERLTYTLGRQGSSIPKEMSLEEWLEGIDDPMAILFAAGDVVTLWAGDRHTLSEAKKKSGRSTAN